MCSPSFNRRILLASQCSNHAFPFILFPSPSTVFSTHTHTLVCLCLSVYASFPLKDYKASKMQNQYPRLLNIYTSNIGIHLTEIASQALTTHNCQTCYQSASTYTTPHIYSGDIWPREGKYWEVAISPDSAALPHGKSLLSYFLSTYHVGATDPQHILSKNCCLPPVPFFDSYHLSKSRYNFSI